MWLVSVMTITNYETITRSFLRFLISRFSIPSFMTTPVGLPLWLVVWPCPQGSLPAFQCWVQKNERAWYPISCDNMCCHLTNTGCGWTFWVSTLAQCCVVAVLWRCVGETHLQPTLTNHPQIPLYLKGHVHYVGSPTFLMYVEEPGSSCDPHLSSVGNALEFLSI